MDDEYFDPSPGAAMDQALFEAPAGKVTPPGGVGADAGPQSPEPPVKRLKTGRNLLESFASVHADTTILVTTSADFDDTLGATTLLEAIGRINGHVADRRPVRRVRTP